MKDDRGPWLVVGASLFAAANRYKFDRAALERNCRWLAEHGVDYIRALACVGAQPYWEGREVDPKWGDYAAVIDGTTEVAYANGIRVLWTCFGDAQIMAPSYGEKERVCDIVADTTVRRRAAVIGIEIANEWWQNGFSGSEGIKQMRALAERIRSKVDVPIAISCPVGDGEAAEQANAKAMYEGSVATFSTNHYDRAMGEDGWRPARQPWQQLSYGGVPEGALNNEPIGIGTPGGNNPTDADPHRQVSQAIVSWIATHWGYCLHDRTAGVRCDKDWSDVSNIDAITAGLLAARNALPSDLPNWAPQNDHWAGHPFEKVSKWVDGASEGVTRAYAAVDGGRSICLPMGIKGGVTMQAKAAMDVDVIDILTGASLKAGALKAGQTIRLTDDPPVYLVRGNW
jgi:hypothetical protein